ncbi:L,D-transpeptidase family protein, partial [Candidatus Uhrbacteria bacterium]|nr:L,D-transpeptidase family protein [Candidatus Uhrbacteria bacterium]
SLVWAVSPAALPAQVQILNRIGARQSSFNYAPKPTFGGASLAAGDLGNDGVPEIVMAAGFGQEPTVTVLRQDGSQILSFLAYDASFTNGLRVALGDVDGDGLNEIVTGPGYGGGPHVRIFDGQGKEKFPGFFAYAADFRGGLFLAVRDLSGDGKAEIITGAGPNGGPHVRVFDAHGTIKQEFFAFAAGDRSGVTVGAADLDGDKTPEILVARASSDPPEVKVFTSAGEIKKTLLPFETSFAGGLTPAGIDLDQDGRDEIMITTNGGTAMVRFLRADGTILNSIAPFGKTMEASLELAVNRDLQTNQPLFYASLARSYREGPVAPAKSIAVRLNEQRLFSYEHGVLIKSFLVSTGIPKYPTPQGEFSVQRKIPLKDYVWTYGPDHPDNYAIRNVKWNLQFKPGYYLHYAYWHNNFGRVKSHGCVNMPLAPSEWIYGWTEVGTPVVIQ